MNYNRKVKQKMVASERAGVRCSARGFEDGRPEVNLSSAVVRVLLKCYLKYIHIFDCNRHKIGLLIFSFLFFFFNRLSLVVCNYPDRSVQRFPHRPSTQYLCKFCQLSFIGHTAVGWLKTGTTK